MIKESLMILSGLESVEITVVEAFYEERKRLLELAESITVVCDDFTAEPANECIQKISKLTRLVENSRKEVKAPILETSRLVDGTAKEYVEPLQLAAKRISKMLGEYLSLVRAAKEKADREIAQKERDARFLAEAEARNAKTEEEQEAAIHRGALAIQAARQEKVALHADEPKGLRVNKRVDFAIEDAALFYQHHPELCEIVAKRSQVLAYLKTNQKVPGLRVWMEESVSTVSK